MNNTPTFVKLKPGEVAVPEWTQYVAQDQTGTWFAYDTEPFIINDIMWSCTNIKDSRCSAIYVDTPNPDWKSTLIKL